MLSTFMLTAGLLFAAIACGTNTTPVAANPADADSPAGNAPVPNAPQANAPVAKAPGAAQAVGDYVTIKGQVKLATIPKPDEVNVTTDKPICCKDGAPLLDTKVIANAKTGGVKNVIVWLRPDDEDRTKTFPQDKIHPDLAKPKSVKHTIDQPNCQFEPRVLAAREGDTLVVKNSATIGHNVNYSSDAESINLTIPPGKQHELAQALKTQRTPIAFKCDIHPWMAGRLRVFDHPYYATTDADGKFEIKLVPAGKWKVVYWHEGGFHKGKDGILGFPIDTKDATKGTMELKPLDLELPK